MQVSIALAFWLGLSQGITELFPFSSLGILVVLPHVIHIPFRQTGARYLPFVVALHVGTALALLLYFRKTWIRLIGGWLRWLGGSHNPDGWLFWVIIVATIPAGIVGLLLKHRLAGLFVAPRIAALFLLVNAGVLWLGERWRRQNRHGGRLRDMTLGQALKVGLFQMFALIPGLSRDGLSMAGGLGQRLSMEDAARLAFLMATPIIGAAALLELPHLMHHSMVGLRTPALVGGVTAGVVAWLSTHFLLRYFQRGGLMGLAAMSFVIGILALALVR
ncbi:MAG: undecaprenyl-diphosphate phosphatase [Firmicutes bacterium]|nr:undecaprenyl-diphosphate phosphatase [Bacillota bacterium]